MATTRIIPLHTGKGRTVCRAISDVIGYVENPEKTGNGKFITGYQCDSRTADAEILLSKKQYIQRTGRGEPPGQGACQRARSVLSVWTLWEMLIKRMHF